MPDVELPFQVTRSITGCARCHGDGHESLAFERLDYPVVCDGVVYTHWATCPTVEQPILLAYVNSRDARRG